MKEFEEINTFWNQVGDLYNSDNSSKITIAIVECISASKLCKAQEIDEPLVVMYYGEEPMIEQLDSMLKFFEKTIQKSLDRLEIEEKLKSGKCLVNFFIPDCPFCKNLVPVWNELEKKYARSDDLTLVSVNCKQQNKLCRNYNPGSRYPSIYWIDDGVSKEKFIGDKRFSDLQDFVTIMIASRVKKSVPEEFKRSESGVYELTKENFYDFISTNCSFVKFFMPGCEACQTINKLWDPLAESLADHENIKIARINCSNYARLCVTEAIGCPTLSVYCNGKRLIKNYLEDFTVEGLADCILSNCKGGQGEFLLNVSL